MVTELDRLARSLPDARAITEELTTRQVQLSLGESVYDPHDAGVKGDAITLAQADRLDGIYAHRHDLSHELIKYVVDPDFEPDVELLTDALTILKSIRRFWTSISSGTTAARWARWTPCSSAEAAGRSPPLWR